MRKSFAVHFCPCLAIIIKVHAPFTPSNVAGGNWHLRCITAPLYGLWGGLIICKISIKENYIKIIVVIDLLHSHSGQCLNFGGPPQINLCMEKPRVIWIILARYSDDNDMQPVNGSLCVTIVGCKNTISDRLL